MERKVIGSVQFDDVLRFQARRICTSMFKSFLILLEEVEEDHDIALKKLFDSLPPQYQPYVKLADYLDEERAKRLRSKILDVGNNAIREFEEQLNNYEVRLKNPNQ